jgi:CO dehydrogenase maturation factor
MGPDIQKTTIMAVCGKGGVGKTSISAAIVRMLLERDNTTVLAIDADPAVGLATALGVDVTTTLNDVRESLITRLSEGEREDRAALLRLLDYEVWSAVVEKRNGLAFLAIGRPESDGCYCQVNDILKDIIGSIAGNFDYVVIDGEAGIEQVNRRVMEMVTHLLLVSDASSRGLNVVRTIKDVADRTVKYRQAGMVLNRIVDEGEARRLFLPADIECIGWVPEDNAIRTADITGTSMLTLPETPALSALRDIVERLVPRPADMEAVLRDTVIA